MIGAWLAAGLAAGAVAQPPADRFAGLVAQGDSAWRPPSYAAARGFYDQALAIDSMGSSRAVFRLGLARAWDGDLPGAIALFRRYVRLEPRDEEGRIALARTYAWHGDTRLAVALYDSITARDRTYRDAALGAAESLAWDGRFRAAIDRYDRWLASNPTDQDALLARARSLAWAGRLAEAERAYQAIERDGRRLEAEKGVAVVAAWRGDLDRSERLWRAIASAHPDDAAAWVGLARVLRWTGRPEAAAEALTHARAADPGNAEAAEQRRWVAADLAPATAPSVLASWDSDRNRSVLVTGAVSAAPFARSRLTVAASHRSAELESSTGRAEAARAELRVALASSLSITAGLGATRTHASVDAGTVDRTEPTAAVSVRGRLDRRIAVGGHASRTVFDETAPLLWSGITVGAVGADAEVAVTDRLSLGAGGEYAELRGGSGPNGRRSGFAAIRWRALPHLALSLSGRAFGYDVQARDGYFAPAQYRQAETGVRWSAGRDLGWAGFVDLGIGLQQVEFAGPGDSRGTQRFGLGLARRPSPGSEIALEYGFSNVSATAAGPTSGGSIYRSHVVSLRIRFIW